VALEAIIAPQAAQAACAPYLCVFHFQARAAEDLQVLPVEALVVKDGCPLHSHSTRASCDVRAWLSASPVTPDLAIHATVGGPILAPAVEKVVDRLLTYSHSVALYNFDCHDSFHRESVAQASSNVFLTEVNTPSDYAIIMRATFLSILVVERRISLDNILRHPEVSENVFIQLTIVLQILTDKFKLVSIGEPVLYRDVGFNYGEFYKFNLIDPLRAIYFFPHKFDGNQFINFMRRQLPIFALLFLSQKLGLFHYRGTPRKQTILDIYRFYGWLSLPIHTFRLVFSLVPGGLVKVIYFLQLCIIHGGWRQGGLVYKMMVGRADRCLRETDFLNHR
jgi:hypothetical protein